MLPAVRGLLVDFGGVIVDGPDDPDWVVAVVGEVTDVLTAAGVAPLPADTIRGALVAGDRQADRLWRTEAPEQPDATSFWRDGLAAQWPPAAGAAVAARGPELSRRYMRSRHAGGWRLRPGMTALLADAGRRGVPVAVVSTLSGAVHREFLRRVGLADRFAAQLYSDEEGVRKPNPELARRAVAAIGVPATGCWFVGDTLTRDVLVARRAGLGAAILMRSL